MILMLLNDAASFTFADLKSKFSSLASHIPSQLIPLCKAGSKQILVKSPAVESFMPGDVFTVNDAFVSKKKKITFNSYNKRESTAEIEDTISRVMADRLMAIDSRIVRLMKEYKAIKHRVLVNEVIDSLKLPLTSKDIAKCIDSLIARDYIRRDDDDPSVYLYIA